MAAELMELKGTNLDTIVYTATRGTAREILGKYAQEDVPDLRDQIAVEIKNKLQTRIDSEATGKLEKNFIIIEAVDLRNTDFDDRIENAIITKQERKQEAEKQEYELQRVEKEREIKIVEADASRQAQILEAEGRGQAILVEATAKAEGITKVNLAYQNMPSQYVEVKYAEALAELAGSGNNVVMDLGRFQQGGNNLGILDYNKLIAKQTTQEE